MPGLPITVLVGAALADLQVPTLLFLTEQRKPPPSITQRATNNIRTVLGTMLRPQSEWKGHLQ